MTGLIILAAGASSRLGMPKQNLLFNGKTLLQHSVDNALASVCSKVIVVLGANTALIDPLKTHPNLLVTHNAEWAEGMGASIRRGLTTLLNTEPRSDSVVLMLCDQPFADTPLINNLAATSESSAKSIIACTYENTVGPPALFNRMHFDELLRLTGNEGAKKLLLKYQQQVQTIPFALGSVDIDTTSDYDGLLREKSE